MTEVHAEHVHLDGATMTSTYAPDANFTGATAVGTNLDFSELMNDKLDGVDFRGATLHGANLHGASLRNANLSINRSVLPGAVSGRVDLSQAELGEADLTGANLTGANTTNWNIFNAHFENTTCPDGSVVVKAAVGPGLCGG